MRLKPLRLWQPGQSHRQRPSLSTSAAASVWKLRLSSSPTVPTVRSQHGWLTWWPLPRPAEDNGFRSWVSWKLKQPRLPEPARHFHRHVAASLPQLALAAVLGAAVAVGSAMVSPDAWAWMIGPQGQRVGLVAVVAAVAISARPLTSAWEMLR